MKVARGAAIKNCIGCEVLVQKDEINEQNINFHRQEMAERWRMQEASNQTMVDSVKTLSTSVDKFITESFGINQAHIERFHKMEKNLIYTAITVVVAAIVAWASKLF